MKILSAEQIRQADAATLVAQRVTGEQLMERAASVFYNWMREKLPVFHSVDIVCGTGNNGGDGLCVARYLFLDGVVANIFIVGDAAKGSPEFQLNLKRLQKAGCTSIYFLHDNIPEPLGNSQCVIDAIFGSGLNRAPEGIFADAIAAINRSDAFKIAIDIPSGLFADQPTDGICVEADITFSFELPKLAFLFPENEKFTGEFVFRSIGLDSAFMEGCNSRNYFLTEDIVENILHERNTFSHKGSYGHALIVAGQPGMSGAANLCGMACLTAGAGLTTISSGDHDIEFNELMSVARPDIPDQIKNNKYNAIGMGPGWGAGEATVQLLNEILSVVQMPVVMDADALNILSAHKELVSKIPPNSILTPHPKEFERLFGNYSNWSEFLEVIRRTAASTKCIIVYKRAYTMIVFPEGNIYFNSTGNAGMATAGSGDVLTGIITALLAQGYTPADAAVTGVYLHGLSGDIAMMESEGQNLVAGDLIKNIQTAYQLLI